MIVKGDTTTLRKWETNSVDLQKLSLKPIMKPTSMDPKTPSSGWEIGDLGIPGVGRTDVAPVSISSTVSSS